MSALARADTQIFDALDSDDTQVMVTALKSLGVWVSRADSAQGEVLRVTGAGGRFRKTPEQIFVGNAGTAVRPLTAVLAVMPRQTNVPIRIHGVARMHERPIGDLVDALNSLGCKIGYLDSDGFPPLSISPTARLNTDAPVQVRGDVSSQFLSSLLMALPLVAYKDIVIEVTGELISKPYVNLTLKLMAQFGVDVVNEEFKRFVIPAGSRFKSPGSIRVEGDASSASYFIAAGVLGSGPLTVKGVGAGSIQGDVEFARVLQRMGGLISLADTSITASGLMPALQSKRLKGGTIDCSGIPDAAMALAVLGIACDSPLTLTGIGSWRVKETDRIAAIATELNKLGVKGRAGPDWLTIEPAQKLNADVEIATYDDHRMAMCFSLVPLLPDVGVDVRIMDPRCVAKTFPAYFEHYQAMVK